jgi:hypothetical protein
MILDLKPLIIIPERLTLLHQKVMLHLVLDNLIKYEKQMQMEIRDEEMMQIQILKTPLVQQIKQQLNYF